MSIALSSTSTPQDRSVSRSSVRVGAKLSWIERAALGVAVFEVPLQLDKYIGFQEEHANLGAVAGLNVSLTLLAMIFLYCVWFASGAIKRSRQLCGLTIGIPMIVYISLVALSVVTAGVRFLAICDLFLVLQAYMLFFYVANRIQDRQDIVFVVGCLAATLVFQSLLIFGLAVLGESGELYDFGPILLSVWSDGRPTGSMQSAVLAGSVMAMLWLPALGLSLSSVGAATKRWMLVSIAIGLVAIMLTQTRGAIATTIVGTGVLGLATLSRGWLPRQAVVAAGLVALISVVPLATVIKKRVLGDDGGSAGARKHLSVIAWDMIQDRPLFGCGSGNCHLAGIPYASRSNFHAEWYYTIHCKYLLTWIETGVFGLLAFLWVIGNGIRQGLGAWSSRHRMLAPPGLAVALAITGYSIHMLVDIFNSRTQVQMLWIVLGLSAAVYRMARSEQSADKRARQSSLGGLSHGA